MRMCHLCGTPQLLRSYKLHFGTCARAWELDEGEKPEGDRRALPTGPRLADGTQPNEKTSLAALEAFNREALSIWKSQALETCPNCRRSFHAKALKAHMKGCHGPSEAYLGHAYVASNPTSRRAGESSRSYPTVTQSLERSPRVAVSKAGPIRLDDDRIESLRVVPRLLSDTLATTDRSETCESPISSRPVKSPSSEATSRRRTPKKNTRRNLASRVRRSLARTRDRNAASPPAHGPSHTSTTAIEARLEALEAGHVAMSETLRRVEHLLRNAQISPRRAEVTPYGSPRSGPQHGKPFRVKEHELVFKGHVDLAWPEDTSSVPSAAATVL